MTYNTARLTALLLLFLFGMGCAKELYRPGPIQVSEGKSLLSVRGTILETLKRRGWKVDKDWKNIVEASYDTGKHLAKIRIPYDKEQVELQYVSSRNLKHQRKNGRETIHRAYNNWVVRLERDLRRSFGGWSTPAPRVSTPTISRSERHRPYASSPPPSTKFPSESMSDPATAPGKVTGENQGAIGSGDKYY